MDKVQEIMSRWNALQPHSERDQEMLSRRFTIDFNYNSNHIEGNTLTYGQTEILLLFGKIIGEAEIRDVQEMAASYVGFKMMREEALLKDIPLSVLDVVGMPNNQDDYTKNRNYRKYLKTKLKKENNEVVSATNQLKLLAPDGKRYLGSQTVARKCTD